MPGVIQPQRPPSSLNSMLSLGQTALGAAKSFGGGSGNQQPDPTQQVGAGNIGSPTAAAQGNAVPSYQPADTGLTDQGQQTGMQSALNRRSIRGQGPMQGGY